MVKLGRFVIAVLISLSFHYIYTSVLHSIHILEGNVGTLFQSNESTKYHLLGSTQRFSSRLPSLYFSFIYPISAHSKYIDTKNSTTLISHDWNAASFYSVKQKQSVVDNLPTKVVSPPIVETKVVPQLFHTQSDNVTSSFFQGSNLSPTRSSTPYSTSLPPTKASIAYNTSPSPTKASIAYNTSPSPTHSSTPTISLQKDNKKDKINKTSSKTNKQSHSTSSSDHHHLGQRFQRKFKQPKNPLFGPIRFLSIPEANETSINQRQDAFNLFLHKMDKIQKQSNKLNNIVIYRIHMESGLGNMIRGYMTALAVAIFTDRAVQIKMPQNYFYKFFFKPFPNLAGSGSLALRRCSFSEWEYYPTKGTMSKLTKVPFKDWWNSTAVVIKTYSDVTSRFLSDQFYGDTLRSIGVLPSDTVFKNQYIGELFRSAFLPLLLNPKENLCNIINSHITKLKEKKVIIGVQMRLGGKAANYHERMFLGPHAVIHFARRVNRYIEDNDLNRDDVIVFISTDSDRALKDLTRVLTQNMTLAVYSVTGYTIGHSAVAKSIGYSTKERDSFMDRAIIDLMLLKESDFLIFSQGSSFGMMAYELQQSYRYPIKSDTFLKEKNLKCSVFHKRTHFGEACYVSKYAGKKKRKN